MSTILPLPKLPTFLRFSPHLVMVLDRIRFRLDDDESFAEFYWFVREYPCINRYHLDHAELRLKKIYQKYQEAHESFAIEHKSMSPGIFSQSVRNLKAYEIYWDFEAYWSAINSALDSLARIVSTAYSIPVPASLQQAVRKVRAVRASGTPTTSQIKVGLTS